MLDIVILNIHGNTSQILSSFKNCACRSSDKLCYSNTSPFKMDTPEIFPSYFVSHCNEDLCAKL